MHASTGLSPKTSSIVIKSILNYSINAPELLFELPCNCEILNSCCILLYYKFEIIGQIF